MAVGRITVALKFSVLEQNIKILINQSLKGFNFPGFQRQSKVLITVAGHRKAKRRYGQRLVAIFGFNGTFLVPRGKFNNGFIVIKRMNSAS